MHMKNIHFILLGGLFVATCIILVTYPTWSPNKLSPEQIRHNVFVKANEQAIQQAKENTKSMLGNLVLQALPF